MLKSALIVVAVFCLAGCAGPLGELQAKKPNVTEKMMWSTYPIGTLKGSASGFVVLWKDPKNPGVLSPVVFTAGHILDSVGKGPLVIGVRVPDLSGEPQVAAIPLPVPRSGPPFYVRHPKVDIGAFEPDVPAEIIGTILPSFLKDTSIARGSDSLRAGTDVSFLGFPDVLPGTPGGFPVLRSGKIASFSTAALQSEGVFLINADVYPGDSGGPVFTAARGGKPKLVGMIVQRIGRSPKTFAHFAIAVDARMIRETLQLLAEREQRPAGKEKAKVAVPKKSKSGAATVPSA
jgi:hypothetical protein